MSVGSGSETAVTVQLPGCLVCSVTRVSALAGMRTLICPLVSSVQCSYLCCHNAPVPSDLSTNLSVSTGCRWMDVVEKKWWFVLFRFLFFPPW